MVGIVPRSAKLMELTGLFSGKAKGLIGRGVGSLTFEGTPVGPCRGGHMPIAGSRPRIFSPRVPVQGSFLSRNPVLHRAPHALESQKIQQYAVSGFRSRSVSKGVATGSETGLSVILNS
jgi:hypothetical protein